MINYTKLGDICLVRRGTTITKKETTGGKIPVIAGGKKATYFHNISNRESGTITISGSGASAGLVNYWSTPIFASDCSTIELKDKKQNIKFIYYYLFSKQEFIYKNLRVGAAQPHVYAKDIAKLEFPLISVKEQNKVVAILDKAFSEIDNLVLSKQKSKKNLNVFYKIQLNSFFIDNSNDWKITNLGSYYDVRDGTHDSPKYVEEGIPLVTSKNLKDGEIDFNKIKYIKNEDYINIKKRSGVSLGDVLMAMIGTIGNATIVKNNNNFAIKNVALFKLKDNQSSDFLKYYLDSSFVVNKMKKDAKGTTQQFVGLGYLRNFPIKIPSYEEQKKISLKIINLKKSIQTLDDKYNLTINNYISLKNSLLMELINKTKAA